MIFSANSRLRVVNTKTGSEINRSIPVPIAPYTKMIFSEAPGESAVILADPFNRSIYRWDISEIATRPPTKLCQFSSPMPKRTTTKLMDIAHWPDNSGKGGWLLLTEWFHWPLLGKVNGLEPMAGIVRAVRLEGSQVTKIVDVWAHAGAMVDLVVQGGWKRLLCYANREMHDADHPMELHFRDVSATVLQPHERSPHRPLFLHFSIPIPTSSPNENVVHVHVAPLRAIIVITNLGMIHVFSLEGELVESASLVGTPDTLGFSIHSSRNGEGDLYCLLANEARARTNLCSDLYAITNVYVYAACPSSTSNGTRTYKSLNSQPYTTSPAGSYSHCLSSPTLLIRSLSPERDLVIAMDTAESAGVTVENGDGRRRFGRARKWGKAAVKLAQPVIRLCDAARIPFAQHVIGIMAHLMKELEQSKANIKRAKRLVESLDQEEQSLRRRTEPNASLFGPFQGAQQELDDFLQENTPFRNALERIIADGPLARMVTVHNDRRLIDYCKLEIDKGMEARDIAIANEINDGLLEILGPERGPCDNYKIPGVVARDIEPNDDPFWSNMHIAFINAKLCVAKIYPHDFRDGNYVNELFKDDMARVREAKDADVSLVAGFCEVVHRPYIAFIAKSIEELCNQLRELPDSHPWHTSAERPGVPITGKSKSKFKSKSKHQSTSRASEDVLPPYKP
ncbi:hypothetical protein FRB99_000132 [Tulasnella sp. 403]|nr:hypothetical protein FRB99_000132 [Tulasnella sp. 403]